MDILKRTNAQQYIHKSLVIPFCALGVVGIDILSPQNILKKLHFGFSVFVICYHVFISDAVHMALMSYHQNTFEEIVSFVPPFVYGVLSFSKLVVVWLKRKLFSQIMDDLNQLWLDEETEKEVEHIRNTTMKKMLDLQNRYNFVNLFGNWMYCITPIAKYLYKMWFLDVENKINFIWFGWYPFDKRSSWLVTTVVYIYEAIVGTICVCSTIGSDLLLVALGVNIVLQLQYLQFRLENLPVNNVSDDVCYKNILKCINLHNRLIRCCNDMISAFDDINLIIIMMSSINICCASFIIVFIEPIYFLGTKMLLTGTLIQIGMICFYSDMLMRANGAIGDAAFKSQWHLMSPKCQRALLLLIIRSRKTLTFTAKSFFSISLNTFTSILTRSYSYFTLLYSVYQK